MLIPLKNGRIITRLYDPSIPPQKEWMTLARKSRWSRGKAYIYIEMLDFSKAFAGMRMGCGWWKSLKKWPFSQSSLVGKKTRPSAVIKHGKSRIYGQIMWCSNQKPLGFPMATEMPKTVNEPCQRTAKNSYRNASKLGYLCCIWHSAIGDSVSSLNLDLLRVPAPSN